MDSSASIGTGHLARCEIIAAEMRKRFSGPIGFLYSEMPRIKQLALRDHGFETYPIGSVDQAELLSLKQFIDPLNRTLFVLDSFHQAFYSPAFQLGVLDLVDRFVFIAFDDVPHYYPHILHMQNPRAPHLSINCEPFTKCLFGLKYVILNSDVRRLSKSTRVRELPVSGLTGLLTFGGSDPMNLTTKVIRALAPLSDRFSRLVVVIGELFPHGAILEHAVKNSKIDIEVLRNVSNMPVLMSSCDIAFGAGGVTTWELGALGVPVVILPSGEHEAASGRFLCDSGLAHFVEDPTSLKTKELSARLESVLRPEASEMAERLHSKIDPNGVDKLVNAMFQ